MGDEESFTGTFSKTEVKESGERVLHFFWHIGGYSVEAAPEQGYKINSIDGDSCYKNTYRYTVPRDRIRLVADTEPGLECLVKETADYGNVRFAKVEADGQEFLIEADAQAGDRVRVAFDAQDVSVWSTRIDMKIC